MNKTALFILGVLMLVAAHILMTDYPFEMKGSVGVVLLGSGITCLAISLISFLASINSANICSAVVVKRNHQDEIVDVYLFNRCTIEQGQMVTIHYKKKGENQSKSFDPALLEICACDYHRALIPEMFSKWVEYHKDEHGYSYEEYKVQIKS